MQHVPPVHIADGGDQLGHPRDHVVALVAPARLTLATDIFTKRAARRELQQYAEGGLCTTLHERAKEAHYVRVAHRRTIADLEEGGEEPSTRMKDE